MSELKSSDDKSPPELFKIAKPAFEERNPKEIDYRDIKSLSWIVKDLHSLDARLRLTKLETTLKDVKELHQETLIQSVLQPAQQTGADSIDADQIKKIVR